MTAFHTCWNARFNGRSRVRARLWVQNARSSCISKFWPWSLFINIQNPKCQQLPYNKILALVGFQKTELLWADLGLSLLINISGRSGSLLQLSISGRNFWRWKSTMRSTGSKFWSGTLARPPEEATFQNSWKEHLKAEKSSEGRFSSIRKTARLSLCEDNLL